MCRHIDAASGLAFICRISTCTVQTGGRLTVRSEGNDAADTGHAGWKPRQSQRINMSRVSVQLSLGGPVSMNVKGEQHTDL